jgi:LacI family transcriptional regulator
MVMNDASVSQVDQSEKSPGARQKRPRGKSKSVREYILGAFSKGDWLPPETEIATRLGVSRYAVAQALNELHVQGLVVREPGRGTLLVGEPELVIPSPVSVAKTVVFICSELSSYLALGLISSLQRDLGDHDCRIALRSSDHRANMEIARIKELRSGGFAGAIIIPDSPDLIHSEILSLHQSGFPIVLMDRPIEGLPVPSVATDHFAGAVEVVSHLISLGHRRIAHITYGGQWHESHAVTLRHKGYLHALQQAGIEPDDSLVSYLDLPPGDSSPDTQHSELSAYIAMHKLLASPARPTAVFAVSDYLCKGIALAATNHGLKIPEQISIAGFDHDVAVWPDHLVLTTYAHPIRELAQAAAAMMSAALNGTPIPAVPVVIPGRLIPGNSTCPPPSPMR